MHAIWKAMGACAITTLMLAAAGCGSKVQSPAAAINGPALGNPQGGGPDQPAAQPKRPRPDSAAAQHPKVIVDTSLGAITVELDAIKAKLTVENFLTYADAGFYDQTIFHQVVKDYVIVGGTFTTSLAEKKAGMPIRNEAHNGVKNTRYTIAMARQPDAIDSATSQFFFNLHDNSLLDYKDRTAQGYGYCVFGRVVAGQEVLDRIAAVEVHNTDKFEQIPTQPILIKSVRRARD